MPDPRTMHQTALELNRHLGALDRVFCATSRGRVLAVSVNAEAAEYLRWLSAALPPSPAVAWKTGERRASNYICSIRGIDFYMEIER